MAFITICRDLGMRFALLILLSLSLHRLVLGQAPGTKLWEKEVAADGASSWYSPALGDNGTLYVVAGGRLLALDGTSGAQVWEFQGATEVVSDPVIGSDGTVYVGFKGGWVFALEGATGARKWLRRLETSNCYWFTFAIGSDGAVYVTSSPQGKVWALEGSNGILKWEVGLDGGGDLW